MEWARSGHNVRGCLERGVGGDYLVHRRRVREEVRRMEEAMYPAARRAEAAKGSRKSPSGCSAAAGEAQTGETAAVAMMGRTTGVMEAVWTVGRRWGRQRIL